MRPLLSVTMAVLATAIFSTPLQAQRSRLGEIVLHNGVPEGWFVSGSKPADYAFGTEHAEGSQGKQSAYIKAKPGATEEGFGTFMQTINADNYIGQRLRLSARLKSEAATGLQLWFRIDGNNKQLAFYNMDDRPVTGNTAWKRYDIVLDVPAGSTRLNYVFFLRGGKGAGWADGFMLEQVDKKVPTSTFQALKSTPTNLNFAQ